VITFVRKRNPRKVWPRRKYSNAVTPHRLSLPDAVIWQRDCARSAQVHRERVEAVEQDPWSPGQLLGGHSEP
jgi:hypothetical protein